MIEVGPRRFDRGEDGAAAARRHTEAGSSRWPRRLDSCVARRHPKRPRYSQTTPMRATPESSGTGRTRAPEPADTTTITKLFETSRLTTCASAAAHCWESSSSTERRCAVSSKCLLGSARGVHSALS